MKFNCKAQYTGMGEFVRCLEEEKASTCLYAVPLGITFFCKSPHWANFDTKQNNSVQKDLIIQEKVNATNVMS